MRFFIKLVLLAGIFLFLGNIYGFFTLSDGFARNIDSLSGPEFLLVEDITFVRVFGNLYYVYCNFNGHIYAELKNYSDAEILEIGKELGVTSEQSLVPFAIGAILFLIILFFPKFGKKTNRQDEEYQNY